MNNRLSSRHKMYLRRHPKNTTKVQQKYNKLTNTRTKKLAPIMKAILKINNFSLKPPEGEKLDLLQKLSWSIFFKAK